MLHQTKFKNYNQIVKEFDVYIMKVSKNNYQFVLKKRTDGPRPPRITLGDLAIKIDKINSRLDNIDSRLTNLETLVYNVIKLNNLRTK